jgi:hypothetical protein
MDPRTIARRAAYAAIARRHIGKFPPGLSRPIPGFGGGMIDGHSGEWRNRQQRVGGIPPVEGFGIPHISSNPLLVGLPPNEGFPNTAGDVRRYPSGVVASPAYSVFQGGHSIEPPPRPGPWT